MSSSLTLGQQMLRSASIFQAIAAISTAFIQGLWLIDLFYTSWSGYRLYDCLTATCTTLLAFGILFCILVARNPHNTPFSILCLEIVKSTSATVLWLWLLLDSLLDSKRFGKNPDEKNRRVMLSAVSVLILLVGFIPTMVFAYANYKYQEPEVVDEEREGERAPLLRS